MSYDKLILDVDEYYRKLFACGWLDEWCDEDIELLHDALKNTAAEHPKFIVYQLSEYSIDPEGICDPESYVQLLKELFTVFQIDINLDGISGSMQGNTITISITDNEEEAVWAFVQNDDWLNDDFLDFINDEVLNMLGEDRVFHPLPPSSHILDIVFQDPDIIDEAYDLGIIPDDSYFIE